VILFELSAGTPKAGRGGALQQAAYFALVLRLRKRVLAAGAGEEA